MKTKPIIKTIFHRAAVMLPGARRIAAALAVMMLTVVQTAWAQNLSGSGTLIDPYLIQSETDWNNLAQYIEDDNSLKGKYVRLTNDISVSKKVGREENPFDGTFSGAGHTITANLTGENDVALFGAISNATIQNLKVEGSITSNGIHPATFASIVQNDCTISNCSSAVAISSTKKNTGVMGGAIVGYVSWGSVNIQDCSFSGSITYDDSAYEGGGLVGWKNNGTVNLTRCLFAPSALNMSKADSNSKTYIFVSGNARGNLTDCYYNSVAKESILQNEGTDASNMTADELVTALTNSGGQWQKDGSGNAVPIISANNFCFANIRGCYSRYLYTGSPISITPIVTADDGTTLTFGTDYTATLGSNNITSLPFSVTDEGNYKLTFTGINSYLGTQAVNFVVGDRPEGLSIDTDYTKEQTGYFYVNMPTSGSMAIPLQDGLTSFKVYDNGGKNGNYSYRCWGTLVLTAPDGYLLQLSGTITSEANEGILTVYDGSDDTATPLLYKVSSTVTGSPTDIATVNSSGQSMTLFFSSTSDDSYAGLDLTVTLVSNNKEFNINGLGNFTDYSISAKVGGASVSKAKANDVVTLTVTPPTNNMLSDFSVMNSSNNAVVVTGGWYTNNQVTFTMPASDVTVSPKFINNWTDEGALYINMPVTGTINATIPETVTSFKIYSRGYYYNCSGNLVLTAPEGYLLQLSGNFTFGYRSSLTVYDGSVNTATKLLDVYGAGPSNQIAIATVNSSGQSMMLFFDTLSGFSTTNFGLDLTVTLVSNNKEFDIKGLGNFTDYSISATVGGTSVSKAKAKDVVTLTVTPPTNNMLSDLSVMNSSNNAVVVTGGWYTNNQVTFTMPASDVTVSPKFINNWTDEGALYINMPVTGTINAIIPETVTSFKIYDDGGSTSSHSKNCNSTLVLTAPEGYVVQLSGLLSTTEEDKMTVYNGIDVNATKMLELGGFYNNIDYIYSTGRSMKICFSSDDSWIDDFNAFGLDLMVRFVNPNAEYDITVTDGVTNGNISATVGGTSVIKAKANDVVTLTFTPQSGYMLYDLNVTEVNNHAVTLDWDYWANTATFRMPACAVTVSPKFTNEWTADGGLYVNMPSGTRKNPGHKSITIPSGVKSFKIYDDGGPNNTYSDNCYSTLVLTAPGDNLIQLSGVIKTQPTSCYMNVYDGSDNTATMLINHASSNYEGCETAIKTVVSTGQSMTIYFQTSNRKEDGLDLIATVGHPISVASGIEYGGLNTDKIFASEGETVTLSFSPTPGYKVSTASYNGTTITPVGNIYSFMMPASAVTVTATFTPITYEITYNLDGGTLPEGVTNPTTYTIETETFTLNNPTREGYYFMGWTGSNGQTPQKTVTIAQGTSNGKKSYTAKWAYILTDITDANVSEIAGKPVALQRTFIEGKPSTICLPFAPRALLDVGSVWEFTGISDDHKAVMTQRTSGLQANTPYIFISASSFVGAVWGTADSSIDLDPKTVDPDAGFTFHGTYTQKHWDADDPLVTGGKIYGFMVEDNDGQTLGQFVKARRATNLRAFSCYLEYDGNLTDTNPSSQARTRGEEELPEVIEIVWRSAGDETGISDASHLMDNGEWIMDNKAGAGWYSLDGRRLSGRPSAKGIYIHEGKKIVIK